MDQLHINSSPTMVTMPISHAQASPTTAVKTSAPIEEIRKDTSPIGAITEKNKKVDMQQLTDELNQIAKKEQLDISFGYNDKIDKVFINIVDKSSGEVIRKLPSEEAIKFAEGMKDLLGKLFDKKG